MEKGKLTENRQTRGASIIMALVYFLICATAGAAVLGAALSGVSHLRSQKINENSYLSVMSAGELLKGRLKGGEGDWLVVNDQDLSSPAGERDRTGYKEEMLEGILTGLPSSSLERALAGNMYQVYLNCMDTGGSWMDLSTEEARAALAEDVTLTFEAGAVDLDPASVPGAKAEIRIQPDYVVMDGTDVQQLQVRLQAHISLEAEGGRQYSLEMTAGGLVHYMLEETVDQEEITRTNPETGEEERETVYRYSYTSHAALSWDKPVFSPGLSRAGEGGGG